MKNSKSMHVFKCGVSAGSMDEMPHTHEFIEIVYVLSGSMTHVIDGQKYKVKHGDILFMNYGCTHAFFSDEEYSYVNILFSPELMSEEIVTPANAFSAKDNIRKSTRLSARCFSCSTPSGSAVRPHHSTADVLLLSSLISSAYLPQICVLSAVGIYLYL